MKKEKTLEQLASVSIHELDDQVAEHPYYVRKYLDEQFEVQRLVADLEAQLENTRAACTVFFRNDSIAKGYRLTKADIDSYVAEDEDCRKIMDDLHEARQLLKQCEKAIKMLDSRERALRNLISLFVAKYWTVPERENGRVMPTAAANGNRRRRG